VLSVLEQQTVQGEYIVIKALEDGVTIIGLTRGKDTRFHHSEKLDNGEVMIAQFTEHTSAIKVRGKAQILTKVGTVVSGNSRRRGEDTESS
jgi:transcription attenuation protein (tryptophan RNA-binding attenuator protein)